MARVITDTHQLNVAFFTVVTITTAAKINGVTILFSFCFSAIIAMLNFAINAGCQIPFFLAAVT